MKRFFILLGLLLAGCSHPKPVDPMMNLPVSVSRRLIIGIINQGSALDRTALEACPTEFPNLFVLDDVDVHKSLRDAGMTIADLTRSLSPTFAEFTKIQGYHLLLIAYRAGNQDFLRMVNYLGSYVTTTVLDIPRPTCQNIFAAERIVFVDSIPPFADVLIGDRNLGSAPIYSWLRDGQYKVQCQLPGQKFKSIALTVPQNMVLTCHREDQLSQSDVQEEEKMSAEEKGGAVLLYIAGIVASLAAIIIPIMYYK